MRKQLYDLKIDSEFHALIPPLKTEARNELEDSIVSTGCLNPLTVWGDTIIDGHNRYEICRRHKIPFEITGKEFNDRDDVVEWIVLNQLKRTDLNSFLRVELVLKYRPIFVKKAKSNKFIKTKTRLYSIWTNMKQRCYNPKNPKYSSYGGKGITVCDEWKNNFMAFYEWAQNSGYQDPPKEKDRLWKCWYALTLDRIDSESEYKPSNCRWNHLKKIVCIESH